jgi:ADP-heptose:LPS heptosyltransferase
MRKVDYWMGISVCFILSIFYRIQKEIVSRKISKETTIKKIMFLEFSEIGSAILAYPAMKKVQETYPDAKLYFWIFNENQDSVRILNIIPKDNIITIKVKNPVALAIDTMRKLWWVRREKIDVVIDMELFSRFSAILSYLSGAKIRVGYYKYKIEEPYRGDLHTHKVIYNPYLHISQNFISLVDSLQARLDEAPLLKKLPMKNKYCLPKIKITNQEMEGIYKKLKIINNMFERRNKIIIMNFGFADKIDIRRWPAEYYLELMQKILGEYNTFIILVGISSTNMKFPNYERCINLIGKTTVKELINLFNISHALVSHDCGIIHIASLTNIYIIAIFGPETPLLYAPLAENKKIFHKGLTCSPCLSAYNHRNSICTDNRCMQAITVDEVYNEIVQMIG